MVADIRSRISDRRTYLVFAEIGASLSVDPLFAEIRDRFSAEVRDQVGIPWPSPYVFSMKHEIHSRIGTM
jgi:hypothetical protein